MPLESIRDKYVLVLGGSDGMGYATAEYLLRSGANVTISARTESKLMAARDKLLSDTGAAPDKLRAIAGDACDAASVEKSVAHAASPSGAIDGIFVVAGGGNFAAVTKNTPETLAAEWALNVFPLANAIVSAVPRMKAAGGSIVALSSGAGVRTYPGLSAYGACKAGLDHYVRVAADELGAHKIRVNAVQPGLTQNGRNAGMLDDGPYTEIFKALTPLGPYGLPEQFGPMVTMLLSEESNWITGQVFAIDGGMTLRAYGGRLQAPE
jgi:NAD(P)-dependent dehydrogenase (short-subunit alcohol dehydrogenase family)